MIYLIDLREQGVGAAFAFWDTVTNRFLEFNGTQGWKTWEDFTLDCDDPEFEASMRRHCPDWVRR